MAFDYDVIVLSGAGVGGGSLVYANTLYYPHDKFFNAPTWSYITEPEGATLMEVYGGDGIGPPAGGFVVRCSVSRRLTALAVPTDSNSRPFLTMRSDRQLLATGGNGFGLFSPFLTLSHLPPVATGCDR